ncbi:signal peptide, CUB and EGF-like domain-containing protein 1 [Strongylocentrotus purpuratus]|uniref:EGF-like domain-containing protein n=1 Tax=Strongylocentrotus purpuratus TaxID=7668 RepID=A0A7M7P4J1_STRPU|nr:signal peptide, CUB and EGF-like domain-containing protein 1 [Strongylocentrotus purpuratus]
METQEVVFVSSYNLWSTEVSDDIRSELATNCISGYFGDLISWTEFVVEVTESNELLLTSPSVCDSFDECVSNPCKYEGTCTNLPNEFTCACRDGFTGPTCEGFVDICQENYCQHGGTCSTIEGQLVCACEVGLSGDHCEFEIIDGGWNGWSPWSECPVTCGEGVHSRTRNCDNPEPQNGGQPCEGEGEQEEPCNTEECPGCIDLKRPLEGYLYCNETPTLINCTVKCPTGYEPENSMFERDEYSCGEDTNYRWNHQTPANPYARLPSCVELQKATEANGFSSVDYPAALCESSAEKKTIEDGFRNQLLGHEEEFECLSLGTCQIESVKVVKCESVAVSERARRAADMLDTGATVMVTTLQNLTHGDDPESQPLGSFLETFNRLVQQDYLVLTVDDQVLEPNKSSVYLDANQKCLPGSFSAIQFGYCVPCGPGTYYSILPDDVEYDCNPCPLNTYQEDSGQTECIPCPNDTVTAEPFSSNISDCFVPEAIPPVTPVTPEPGLEERTKIIISVTSFIAGLLVFAVAIVWYSMWHRRRTKNVRISTDEANSLAHDSDAVQLVELRGEASENPTPK